MNIVATGRAADILETRGLLLTPAVLGESIYIYGDDARESRLRIDEELLAQLKLRFRAVSLTDEEIALAVRYSEQVDDGEAQTLAVGATQRVVVLTDDGRAIRYAATLGITTTTTLDIIKAWTAHVEPAQVRLALRAMRSRANYAVPRQHALREWYAEHLEDAIDL